MPKLTFKVINAKPRRDIREKFFASWAPLDDPDSDDMVTPTISGDRKHRFQE